MGISLKNSYLQQLASDTRHLLRSPGLAAVTFMAVILILLFIVFPIGSVLVKSFSVTYPTVTVRCRSDVATSPDFEKLVIGPILAALKPIAGIDGTDLTLASMLARPLATRLLEGAVNFNFPNPNMESLSRPDAL